MDGEATDLEELFPSVYLRLHRRHRRDDLRLTPQMSAVLHHLAMSGPLTIGEMARHFARAQSVVSEIVDGLEKKALLARMRDERDRRRVLVWLTDDAHDALKRERQVLDPELVRRALAGMTSAERNGLFTGLRALVRAADRATGRQSR
jgi:DNA-binding MarR family transcriptional regulator